MARESAAYEEARARLREAEIALRDQREAVAALRRELPLDSVIGDETFEEIRDGKRVAVTLAGLFEDDDKPLVLMHFMYGKAQLQPCPMCSLWADGYSGVQDHLRQRTSFAVLVAGDVGTFADWGRRRGWSDLRLVGAADSGLKSRLGFETADGDQMPGVSVFTKNDAGELVHVYSQEATFGPGEFRAMDLLSPVWHYFDLLPEGRGDFLPKGWYPPGT